MPVLAGSGRDRCSGQSADRAGRKQYSGKADGRSQGKCRGGPDGSGQKSHQGVAEGGHACQRQGVEPHHPAAQGHRATVLEQAVADRQQDTNPDPAEDQGKCRGILLVGSGKQQQADPEQKTGLHHQPPFTARLALQGQQQGCRQCADA